MGCAAGRSGNSAAGAGSTLRLAGRAEPSATIYAKSLELLSTPRSSLFPGAHNTGIPNRLAIHKRVAMSRLLHKGSPRAKPTVSIVAASKLLNSRNSRANFCASPSSFSLTNSSSSVVSVTTMLERKPQLANADLDARRKRRAMALRRRGRERNRAYQVGARMIASGALLATGGEKWASGKKSGRAD